MYRTESLVQYFTRLAFLNFILSCFFLYLKVYANEAECKQWSHERLAYTDHPQEIQQFWIMDKVNFSNSIFGGWAAAGPSHSGEVRRLRVWELALGKHQHALRLPHQGNGEATADYQEVMGSSMMNSCISGWALHGQTATVAEEGNGKPPWHHFPCFLIVYDW